MRFPEVEVALLIEPQGIETPLRCFVSVVDFTLLIEPQGIETSH